MKSPMTKFFLSAAVFALAVGMGTASAEATKTTTSNTVVSETKWSSTEKPVLSGDVRTVNFIDFDVNNDKLLSRSEVGAKLFKIYDTDGNEVLDNMEWSRAAIITIHPIEKTTIVTYDFNGDGIVDKTQATYEDFMRQTMLSRFDKNGNGLSAHEFTGLDFMAADINNDKSVDMKEFEGTYNTALDKMNKAAAEVNR